MTPSGLFAEDFFKKYQEERPVAPITAYVEGKKYSQSLYDFELEPLLSEEGSDYSLDGLIEANRKYHNETEKYIGSFSALTSRTSLMVDGFFPERQAPVIVRIIHAGKETATEEQIFPPRHICDVQDDYDMFLTGHYAGKLLHDMEQEENCFGVVSNLESLLSEKGESWGSLRDLNVKKLSNIAGDLKYAYATFDYEYSLKEYMDNFNIDEADFGTLHHLSESPSTVINALKKAKSMYMIAGNQESTNRTEKTGKEFDSQITDIWNQIIEKNGFLPY